tara:strand:- start:1051 stop:1359 length:309 start_codon:yes stop_codon:yes gene_type:complete
MTTQPEALRLADKMSNTGWSIGCAWDCHQASVELRRLHDEVQQLKSDLSEEVLISNTMLEVKDELLEALKALNDYYGMSVREQIETERAVKAAIAKAERTTP